MLHNYYLRRDLICEHEWLSGIEDGVRVLGVIAKETASDAVRANYGVHPVIHGDLRFCRLLQPSRLDKYVLALGESSSLGHAARMAKSPFLNITKHSWAFSFFAFPSEDSFNNFH